MQIITYKCSADPIRVDKTAYLETIDTLDGTFREQTSILNMTMTLAYDRVPAFNYVYVPEFGRYYFVSNPVMIRNGLWNINLSIDVLMTYRDAIHNLTAFVDRSETGSNPMLLDDLLAVEEGQELEDIEITNYVLTPEESIDQGTYVIDGYCAFSI